MQQLTYVGYTSDHHMLLSPAYSPPEPFDCVGGLIGALSISFPIIETGVAGGPVTISVVHYDSEPEANTSDWEDVAELSILAETYPIIPGVEEGVGLDEPPPDARLDFLGPGWYRIRIHARNRDAAHDLIVESPVEDYLIEVWPAPPAQAMTLKVASEYGRILQEPRQYVMRDSPYTEPVPKPAVDPGPASCGGAGPGPGGQIGSR